MCVWAQTCHSVCVCIYVCEYGHRHATVCVCVNVFTCVNMDTHKPQCVHAHVCIDQRRTSGVILSFSSLRQVLFVLGLCIIGFSCLCLPSGTLGFQMCAPVPGSSMRSEDLNPGASSRIAGVFTQGTISPARGISYDLRFLLPVSCSLTAMGKSFSLSWCPFSVFLP